jgi:ABC-type lipoprotein release transport system permease subunit
MKSIVEVRENLILYMSAISKNTFIFFDKRLKLFSTDSKNQKWSDCNASFFSLLNLKSAIIYTFLLFICSFIIDPD